MIGYLKGPAFGRVDLMNETLVAEVSEYCTHITEKERTDHLFDGSLRIGENLTLHVLQLKCLLAKFTTYCNKVLPGASRLGWFSLKVVNLVSALEIPHQETLFVQ